MKVQASRIDGFIARPDPVVRAILVYGPDAGLVRERAERLCRSVVPELNDPFRVVELGPAILRDDPARLADEAAQLSMIGGRRVVRLRDGADSIASVFEAFLDDPAGDALIVVDAADLSARSKLRNLFESAKNAAAIPCYADSEEDIAALVEQMIRQAGLAIAPDALETLVANLGGDRQLTRREIEKLILYVGANATQVCLGDVEACVGDSTAHSIDDALLAAADGDARAVVRALARAFAEGESAVGVIRAAQRHFQRLHFAAGQVDRGESIERAIDSLKPKVFWKRRAQFMAQLRSWTTRQAAQALDRLTAAELACKSTGMPDEAIVTRCLLELASAACRQKRRA
jgi:DNA polymerase-3 subunit delta